MGRTARRSREPYLPPVEKIELSSAHSGWKLAAAVVFLLIGAAALAYGFMGLFSANDGWQQIETDSASELNCGDEFILYYDLGAGEMSASAEKKALTKVYSEAAVNAYRLFSGDEDFGGAHNVFYLNHHPNETVQVDPALYAAFEQIRASGDRSLYLGPVYEIYNGIFSCADDAMTADFDPWQNEELRCYFAACADFGADPAAVDVELLDGGQVRLNVSEDYLAFADENEIESFIDFYWMKNAFIADYLADFLIEHGYTRGAVSSYDGFVRNLAGSDEIFGFNVYDRTGDAVTRAAVMQYSGAMSIVYLHDYPMSDPDSQRYYQFRDGQIRTAYLDTADGLCRSALNDLTAYAADKSCAEILLKLIPAYVAESFDAGRLEALAGEGIGSAYCADQVLIYYNNNYNNTSVRFGDLAEGYTAADAAER